MNRNAQAVGTADGSRSEGRGAYIDAFLSSVAKATTRAADGNLISLNARIEASLASGISSVTLDELMVRLHAIARG